MAYQSLPTAEDRRTIDITDDYRLREWADNLDVSVDELRLAVIQVGPSLKAVRAYLALD